MTDDTVLGWYPEKSEAIKARDGHARTLRALQATAKHGVRLEPYQGGFKVVLVKRQ
jgi:hypothetical protein